MLSDTLHIFIRFWFVGLLCTYITHLTFFFVFLNWDAILSYTYSLAYLTNCILFFQPFSQFIRSPLISYSSINLSQFYTLENLINTLLLHHHVNPDDMLRLLIKVLSFVIDALCQWNSGAIIIFLETFLHAATTFHQVMFSQLH